MLRKVVVGSIVAFFAMVGSVTAANATCPTYHMLSNGSVANADSVMDNYEHILGCPQFTGNISIGTSPYTWGSTFDHVIDIGAGAAIDTSSTNLVIDLMSNIYANATNYIMKTTNYGNFFRVGAADFQWYQGSFTGAGSATTLARTMYLDYYGNLTINGCLHYNSSTLGTCLSDERLKQNIKPFNKIGLAEISALRPVTYSYNGLANTPNDVAGGATREGLIAQQVQKVAPSLVSTVHRKLRTSDQSTAALLEVNYGALTFGLINAVKELKATNDNQIKKIALLEARLQRLDQEAADVRELRSRLGALERRVALRTAENLTAPHH